MERVKRKVSYADLQRMPEDGNRYELYDGELYVVPSPLPRHQIISRRIFVQLFEFTCEQAAIDVSTLTAEGYGPSRIVASGAFASPTMAGFELDVAALFEDV